MPAPMRIYKLKFKKKMRNERLRLELLRKKASLLAFYEELIKRYTRTIHYLASGKASNISTMSLLPLSFARSIR